MKRLFLMIPLLAALGFICSCSKDSDEPSHENQWKANFDGKDSVYTITKATLQTVSGRQHLSIITELKKTCFDMYVNAPNITAKEYPIASPFSYPFPDEYACCYYRILQPDSYYTARAFVSTEVGPEYKVVITELSDTKVKGTIKFKGVDQGYNTSGEMIISASFSTDILEVEN